MVQLMREQILEHSIVNHPTRTATASVGLARRTLLKCAVLACGSVALSLLIPSSALGRADATPQQGNQAGAAAKPATELSPKPPGSAQLKDYPFFPFCIDWHDAKKLSLIHI